MNDRERREYLDRLAEEKIIILDGAMGSLIQSREPGEADYRGARFASHPVNLFGCNDVLCLTRPDLIISIHDAYLEAGADIITTCSFNSTSVSLADYGLEDMAYEISKAAALCARKTADKYAASARPRFVAGSVGPTAKSLCIAPDLNDPGKRGVDWAEMEAAYYDNVRGLLDGGADIILIETVFDTLNARAALFAVSRLFEERNVELPVMISATVSDASGRLLCGQTLEAFAVSVLHARPWALGLNCSLGAEKLLPHLERLAAFAPVLISCHPNAGLPNRFGGYDEGPEVTAGFVKEFFDRGLVNIIGGCCGTTPAHTAALAKLAESSAPRKRRGAFPDGFLAGLEVLPPQGNRGGPFISVGERTNVAGSRKFLRLVKEGRWEQAAGIARDMIEPSSPEPNSAASETLNTGAEIIDICMDDALLDGKAAMIRFLNLCLSDPEIARVPVMADSSSWEILEAAMQCMPGKGIINSISLKEGEAEFLRRASLARRYGAAVVVMLFDEEGQAVSFEQRIAVAERSYKLLSGAGFPAGDIIFDPNVLTVATGMSEHDRYALDFIRACAWIREHCPLARISGGISNLSFSFRGNEIVRRAMHAVFLKHAADAGLSMAIVNPASLVSRDELPPELWEAAEDVILCRKDHASEKLLALALDTRQTGGPENNAPAVLKWRDADAEERVIYALLKGADTFIEEDILELNRRLSPLDIVEGPLMRAMQETGKRFGEGTMFLPQVIRCARVMKKAVAVLEPFMETSGVSSPGAGNIVIATVKGDVHDIGKNIAGLVMGCNGYNIIDLGVMVPRETIVDAAERENARAVGLSGLISPSLEEMIRVAQEMERRRCTIPLLIGGAAASLAHTALRIAPAYSGPVIYVRDAGESALALHALFSGERQRFLDGLEREYDKIRSRQDTGASSSSKKKALSIGEARANRLVTVWEQNPPPRPAANGILQYDDYPLEKIIPLIDWQAFYRFWELNKDGRGNSKSVNSEAEQKNLRAEAEQMLEEIAAKKILVLRGVLGFFPARSEGDDVVVYREIEKTEETCRFCFLRNQETQSSGGPNLCLADFIPDKNGRLGLFALSAGFGFEEEAALYRGQHDDYHALLLASLASRLAEAFSGEVYRLVREELLPGPYPLIRPAFGYPVAPDHHDKALCFRLLEAEQRTGMSLNESAMIHPVHSVCGMYFAHPRASYFNVGTIAADQLADWARRKNITEEEARRRIGVVL
jgi:5-methyltetrahydrofolate--homocysteine methyltransferase